MTRLKKKIYKNNETVKESHNCYAYFLNEVDKDIIKDCKKTKKKNKKRRCRRPQPGYAVYYNNGERLIKAKNYNCKELTKRTLADNKSIYKTTFKKKCKKNYYKGALFLDPYNDYHYYREDKPGRWSHKQGWHIPSSVDAKGNKIKNPEKAEKKYKSPTKRNIYNKLCNYFCIPKDTKKKMSAYPNKNIWKIFGGTQKRRKRRKYWDT